MISICAVEQSWDPLEKPDNILLLDVFCKALKRSNGHPRFNPLMIFKVLVLQALYMLSDDRGEFRIQDRFPSCGSLV